MKPVDLRQVHFHEVSDRLVGNRLEVMASLQVGEATGSELAARMDWPVTSVRPRLTELREMFCVRETGVRRNGEHVFRACSADEIRAALDVLEQMAAETRRKAERLDATQLSLFPA